jgi:peptidoglycan/LPS O-acetylase OafA/YrhL
MPSAVSESPTTITLSSAIVMPTRLSFLEGLRALAALWVVLSHAWIMQCGLFTHLGLLGWMTNWLIYSHLAVDVFIVLSGFCLTLPLLRDGTLRGGAWAFWKRRAQRILPPCYLALVLAVGTTMLLQRWTTGLWHLDFRALGINVLLLQDMLLRDNIFNGSLWSIAVECRMYLVFPLLAWALRRGAAMLLVPTAVIGYSLTVLIFKIWPAFLMACPWYLLLFAMGMCAAAAAFPSASGSGRQTPRHSVPESLWPFFLAATLLLILLLHAFPVTPQSGVNFGRHMPFIDADMGALTALMLLVLCRRHHDGKPIRGATLLSWPPLVILGQFSYSLYLVHEPVLRVLSFGLAHCLDSTPELRFAALTLIGLPLTILIAYGFFCGCERPFLKSQRRG